MYTYEERTMGSGERKRMRKRERMIYDIYI